MRLTKLIINVKLIATIQRSEGETLLYTEPHHIVPMSKQDYFENSLDVEENIISLCCNCHKQIHLGKGFEDMLRKIYAERKDVLKKGIEILLEDLILFYKMEGN
jgi:5-methylcytosine-specific restriction protein A